MSLTTRLTLLLAVVVALAMPGPGHEFYVQHIKPGVQHARAALNNVMGMNK
jgi:hypothetical protein